MNEIIDWEAKGNVIRFYLGKNGDQWGDDWDDAPWEYNAGRVYDEYVEGTQDLVVPFTWDVELCGATMDNSPYTKQNMVNRKVACLTLRSPGGREINIMFGDKVPDLATLSV